MPPRTGVGRYVDGLCRAIVEADPSVECDFLYPLSIQRGIGGSQVMEPPHRRGRSPSRLFFQRIIYTPPFTRFYPTVMDALFRLRTLGGGYDLYHETNYVPRPFRGPTVVTVYDLSLVFYPETHPQPRVYIFKRDFARRVGQVDRFLTISQAVKEELVGALAVDPERIVVTRPGVDATTFYPLESAGLPGDSSASRGSLEGAPADLPQRYLLFVGSLEPRKGLATLFQAYARLPARLREAYSILLVGPVGWKFGPVWELVRSLGLEDRTSWRGFVPEEVLPVLYRRATAFVFPSIYEGFGLPLLEAMASGTCVVCSELPSIVEVVGGAALRIPPLDVEAWTEALRRVLEDEELRVNLRSAGLQRAAQFTWRRCAEETLAVYRELAS
jgi:glycosyltransferase involved in cell wall biosynthesis